TRGGISRPGGRRLAASDNGRALQVPGALAGDRYALIRPSARGRRKAPCREIQGSIQAQTRPPGAPTPLRPIDASAIDGEAGGAAHSGIVLFSLSLTFGDAQPRPFNRGSSRSRTASPSMLKPNTARLMARPG